MRKRVCSFCAEKTNPTYNEAGFLKKYITERGKIIPRAKSGVCATHQRQMSKEIKRARILAMLSASPQV